MASTSTEVDIIIVGGGAAGCVIAGRLAKANPELQVLILESGKDNRDDPFVVTPALFAAHLKPESQTAHYYVSKPNEYAGGRSHVVRSGGLLGGGSSINFMMYTRASASDYDDWDTEGWTFNDLKPLLKKTETYHPHANDDSHGYEGPLHVSYGCSKYKIADEFINTAKSYAGIDQSIDVNDFRTVNKTCRWPKWINPHTGKRSDAAHGFVHPVRDSQQNLHLLLESKAIRIIFEGTKAVGVEYVANKLLNPSADQSVKTVRARKMVIISAGALSTPQILERSGIGDASRLKSLSIDVVSDLPGVGQSYQDHHVVGKAAYQVDVSSDDTGDDILRGDPDAHSRLADEFKHGKGAFVWNFLDTGIKYRPTQDEIKSMGSEFENAWKEYFANKPDKPLIYIGPILMNQSPVTEGRYLTSVSYLEYPLSRGEIHITSKDVYADPDFTTGFLSHPADLPPQILAYKKIREIVRRMPCYRGEYAPSHPSFPVGSAAARWDTNLPKAKTDIGIVGGQDAKDKSIPDIEYTEEDDKAIESWVRDSVETTWHSMGTCAMKPKIQGGVVDKYLNVYGTQNLKVADISICPGNVGANTYSTALLVGEKAARILAEDLGLKCV